VQSDLCHRRLPFGSDLSFRWARPLGAGVFCVGVCLLTAPSQATAQAGRGRITLAAQSGGPPAREADHEQMALSPGTVLGPYEVTGHLGTGGMGEVYKARDARLDRTVAIKVLPEHVTADPGSSAIRNTVRPTGSAATSVALMSELISVDVSGVGITAVTCTASAIAPTCIAALATVVPPSGTAADASSVVKPWSVKRMTYSSFGSPTIS